MMLTLAMMSDNDIASEFKATIRILFAFGRIIVLIICNRSNSPHPLFSTALVEINLVFAQLSHFILSISMFCYKDHYQMHSMMRRLAIFV